MLRRTLKKIYHSVAFHSGSPARRLGQIQREGLAAILNLHRVSPERNDYWPPLTPTLFEELLNYLSDNFHVCRIDELSEVSPSKPIAMLSFDDGYYDFIEYALPLIEKYGLPVNMNVIPECAISGRPIWNVRLYDFLHSSTRAEINLMDIPGFATKLESEDPAAKVAYGVALSRYLKNRPRGERVEIWESIEPRIAEADGGGTRMMTTDDIREIGERVDIGAHSFSHESMAFEPESFFEGDIDLCRHFFETDLGMPLSIYAFPNGSYRPQQVDLLRKRGFSKILLVDERLANPKADVLTRLTIYGESSSELKMRCLGF